MIDASNQYISYLATTTRSFHQILSKKAPANLQRLSFLVILLSICVSCNSRNGTHFTEENFQPGMTKNEVIKLCKHDLKRLRAGKFMCEKKHDSNLHSVLRKTGTGTNLSCPVCGDHVQSIENEWHYLLDPDIWLGTAYIGIVFDKEGKIKRVFESDY